MKEERSRRFLPLRNEGVRERARKKKGSKGRERREWNGTTHCSIQSINDPEVLCAFVLSCLVLSCLSNILPFIVFSRSKNNCDTDNGLPSRTHILFSATTICRHLFSFFSAAPASFVHIWKWDRRTTKKSFAAGKKKQRTLWKYLSSYAHFSALLTSSSFAQFSNSSGRKKYCSSKDNKEKSQIIENTMAIATAPSLPTPWNYRTIKETRIERLLSGWMNQASWRFLMVLFTRNLDWVGLLQRPNRPRVYNYSSIAHGPFSWSSPLTFQVAK